MHIEHIAMYVKDLEKAKRFFQEYFGAIPGGGYYNPKTSFRSCFLSFDCGARLELMNKPGHTEGGSIVDRAGYAHLAISTGSKRAVDDLTVRLKNDGYEVISGPRTTGDGYYESCIIALEDNQVEITV